MTKQEIKNRISEHKECCKKLAEEYRQRYNEDKTDKLALNMFYHNVIAYNNFETILSMIEDRNSMIMCFSEPPILTEKTVEVELNRIAELEKENAELKKELKEEKDYNTTLRKEIDEYTNSHTLCVKYKELQQENAELKAVERMALYSKMSDQLTKAKEIISELLSWERRADYDYAEYDLIKDEAEQFISEVEK